MPDNAPAAATAADCEGCTLVAFAGHAGAGKDTAADYLCRRYGFVRVSFAEPIKLMLLALFDHLGIDHAYVTEPSGKHKPIDALHGLTARYMLQTLGTQCGRNLWHQDIWVRALALATGLHDDGTPVHDRIVISDLRFPNEMRWVRRWRGTIVRVHRDQTAPPPSVAAHESEQLVPHLRSDVDLRNNGSLASLHDQLDGIMLTRDIDERDPLPQTF